MKQTRTVVAVAMVALMMVGACGKKKPPVARVTPPPPSTSTSTGGRPPGPPEPVREPVPVPAEPIASDTLSSTDIDTLNKNSPFQPVFFAYDEDVIDALGQQALGHNAELMKKYTSWIVTIEGHSDERGTAEYNLALGERRALVVKEYLEGLGVSSSRIRTVSLGKEARFCQESSEGCWSKNRRGHFVIIAK